MLFLLQFKGQEQKGGRGETVVFHPCFNLFGVGGGVIQCQVKRLVEADLET